MESVAVVPIPVVCPAAVYVPPARVVPPVPRRFPCVPVRSPEPIVNHWSIDIYRLDNVVGAIDVFVADHLHFDLILRIFLNIDGGYVLKYILC